MSKTLRALQKLANRDPLGELLRYAAKQARFPEGESVDVPAYLREHGNPEAADAWDEMNEEYGGQFKTAYDTTLADWEAALSRDEKDLAKVKRDIDTLEGGGKVPNLTLANAEAIHKALTQMVENKKKLIQKLKQPTKTAALEDIRLDNLVVTFSWNVTDDVWDEEDFDLLKAAKEIGRTLGVRVTQVNSKGAQIDLPSSHAVFTLWRQIKKADTSINDGIVSCITMPLEAMEFTVYPFGFSGPSWEYSNWDDFEDWVLTDLIEGGRSPDMAWARKHPWWRTKRASDESVLSRYEEGVPADPTENMNPEDAAEWKRQNEEHKDNFKNAARYSNDPFWMTAKYPGRAKDGTPFKKGDKIFYYPKTKTILVGKDAEKASREFDAQVADEDMYNYRAAAQKEATFKRKETEEDYVKRYVEHKKQSRFAKKAVRRPPGRGDYALVKQQGLDDIVLSLHPSEQDAEKAMRKHGGEPNSMFQKGMRIVNVGPNKGMEMIEVMGKWTIRHRGKKADIQRLVDVNTKDDTVVAGPYGTGNASALPGDEGVTSEQVPFDKAGAYWKVSAFPGVLRDGTPFAAGDTVLFDPEIEEYLATDTGGGTTVVQPLKVTRAHTAEALRLHNWTGHSKQAGQIKIYGADLSASFPFLARQASLSNPEITFEGWESAYVKAGVAYFKNATVLLPVHFFKTAVRIRENNLRLAGVGLYGFTKGIQRDCEGCTRKLSKIAERVAKEAYAKDEKVAPFLAMHAKRTESLPAKVLVAALGTLGPKIAAAQHKEGLVYGLYGFRNKTANLGLSACMQIREEAGKIAAAAHRKKATRHAQIIGFLTEHAKQANCVYSSLLHQSYPDPD